MTVAGKSYPPGGRVRKNSSAVGVTFPGFYAVKSGRFSSDQKNGAPSRTFQATAAAMTQPLCFGEVFPAEAQGLPPPPCDP